MGAGQKKKRILQHKAFATSFGCQFNHSVTVYDTDASVITYIYFIVVIRSLTKFGLKLIRMMKNIIIGLDEWISDQAVRTSIT